MEPALGLVLDSSVLVAAERANLTTPDVIKHIRASVGDVPIGISALTECHFECHCAPNTRKRTQTDESR